MATQRLTVVTLAGQSAIAVFSRFDQWRAAPFPDAVDQFCITILDHALSLPIVYFANWCDRWLSGNIVPGPKTVEGRRFEATCLSPAQAIAWAEQCGSQFAEHCWFAARLREASGGWGEIPGDFAIVVIREVVGALTTDEEVRSAMDSVPTWLTQAINPA